MMVDQNGRSVGVPSDLEARKYLVLSGGDVMTAGREVYLFRKKKVCPYMLTCVENSNYVVHFTLMLRVCTSFCLLLCVRFFHAYIPNRTYPRDNSILLTDLLLGC